MPKDLIQFWQDCTLINPPFAHPQDLDILRERGRCRVEDDDLTFESYILGRRFGDVSDDRFHLSLYPVPYIGDLETADIVILMLNPGFEYSDYWGEMKVPEFREGLRANLRQSFKNTKYPFIFLDPKFCWHTGFIWWEKKLREVIQCIAKQKFDGNYGKALQDLSTRLACVELLPYHSARFADHRLIRHLPSVKAALKFVETTLVPEAKAGKRIVIATRQVKTWNLSKKMKGVTTYEGGHTRGASMSLKSEGGKAILQRYDIK